MLTNKCVNPYTIFVTRKFQNNFEWTYFLIKILTHRVKTLRCFEDGEMFLVIMKSSTWDKRQINFHKSSILESGLTKLNFEAPVRSTTQDRLRPPSEKPKKTLKQLWGEGGRRIDIGLRRSPLQCLKRPPQSFGLSTRTPQNISKNLFFKFHFCIETFKCFLKNDKLVLSNHIILNCRSLS